MSHQQTAADKRPLWALVVANFISEGGNAISYLAIPWYVNEITDDAFLVGLTSAVGVAAFVLGSFFGGSLADRYDRRVVAVVADGASGVAVQLIPALHALDALSVPVLLVLVFLGAALDAPGYAAKMALIPELSRRSGASLERANGLVSGAASAAEVGGPVLAGLLLTIASTPTALVVDGLSFFVSMGLLFIYLPKRMGRQGDLTEEDLAHVSARDGVRFLSRPGPPRTITLANLATNFIGAPLFTVIMVVYLADHTAGGLSLGVLVAIGGIGLTVGAFAFARIGEQVSRRSVLRERVRGVRRPVLVSVVRAGRARHLGGVLGPWAADRLLQPRRQHRAARAGPRLDPGHRARRRPGDGHGGPADRPAGGWLCRRQLRHQSGHPVGRGGLRGPDDPVGAGPVHAADGEVGARGRGLDSHWAGGLRVAREAREMAGLTEPAPMSRPDGPQDVHRKASRRRSWDLALLDHLLPRDYRHPPRRSTRHRSRCCHHSNARWDRSGGPGAVSDFIHGESVSVSRGSVLLPPELLDQTSGTDG